MNNSLPYYLTFSHFVGIGPTRLFELLTHFGNAEIAYKATAKELNHVLGGGWGSRFTEFKHRFDPVNKLEEYNRKGIHVLSIEDSTYPPALRNLKDPPICLYIKGDLQSFDFLHQRFFSIVGSRTTSEYGRSITKIFASELVGYGFTIVSGMAIGIDSAAHWATLDAGGKTIAFLGCGVDIPNPPSNTLLYNKILEKKGLVISEFPPGMRSTKGLFISRNRLISGLSEGVLVIEGLKDSGSLITAKCALEQGKEVFAPSSPMTSSLSEAPYFLLRNGAKLAIGTEEILEALHMPVIKGSKKKAFTLDQDEQLVYDGLLSEPQFADQLALGSKIPIYRALTVLSSLEMQGIVEKNIEGKYQVKV